MKARSLKFYKIMIIFYYFLQLAAFPAYIFLGRYFLSQKPEQEALVAVVTALALVLTILMTAVAIYTTKEEIKKLQGENNEGGKMQDKKEKAERKLCSCGFPQSYPIPHEHDRTEREKAIIAHYEAIIKEKGGTCCCHHRRRRL
jgi:hypothetical protein